MIPFPVIFKAPVTGSTLIGPVGVPSRSAPSVDSAIFHPPWGGEASFETTMATPPDPSDWASITFAPVLKLKVGSLGGLAMYIDETVPIDCKPPSLSIVYTTTLGELLSLPSLSVLPKALSDGNANWISCPSAEIFVWLAMRSG